MQADFEIYLPCKSKSVLVSIQELVVDLYISQSMEWHETSRESWHTLLTLMMIHKPGQL
jgi:hypothetical protein